MSMTVEKFKKLMEYERPGYEIFVSSAQIVGLSCDPDEDSNEPLYECTFVFDRDPYQTVENALNHADCKWTVMKCTEVDWDV